MTNIQSVTDSLPTGELYTNDGGKLTDSTMPTVASKIFSKSPRQEPRSLKSWTWKVIRWPIEKIVALIRWVFPGSFKKNSYTELLRAPLCPRTVGEFVADLHQEMVSLQGAVKQFELNFDQGLEDSMDVLTTLHSLHYEIEESANTIADLLHRVDVEQAVTLRGLHQEYSSIRDELNKKITKNSGRLRLMANAILQEDGKNSDIWTLRNRRKVCQFVEAYREVLTPPLSRTLQALNLSGEPGNLPSIATETLRLEIKRQEAELRRIEEDAEAQAVASLKGIPNVGASCYMNSCLQVLLGTRLTDFLDREPSANDDPLFAALREFRGKYQSAGMVTKGAALAFRSAVANSDLVSGDIKKNICSPQDAEELMVFLLRAIDFHHQYMSKHRIVDAIPDVLVIRKKLLNIGTSIPWNGDTIDMKDWMDPALVTQNGGKTTYRLAAYVNHQGSLMGSGHFTANVRKGRQFYRLNDRRVNVLNDKTEISDREKAYFFVLERER